MKIQNQLGYIKGITFAPYHKRGSLSTQTARDSFDYMIEHTAADFVILAPAGLQEHAHSEEICYRQDSSRRQEEDPLQVLRQTVRSPVVFRRHRKQSTVLTIRAALPALAELPEDTRVW